MTTRNILMIVSVISLAFAAVANSSEVVKYVYTDAQGTILVKTDAQGSIIELSDYSPYARQVLGEPVPGPGYTGHVTDPETNLIYMKARYYDPEIGRFTSIDPKQVSAGEVTNYSRYVYARDNPMIYVDPNGRDAIITHKKDGSLAISVPIKFSGPGVSDPNIVMIKADAATRWSGTFAVHGVSTKVTMEITDVPAGQKPMNEITLTTGPTSDRSTQGASFVRGGKSGEWNVNSPGMASGEAGHETGHLMREADHYASSVDANGNRTTTPSAGYEGNIMGELPGSADGRNIEKILGNSNNKVEYEK
jgi:RHS repeat-associated protein